MVINSKGGTLHLLKRMIPLTVEISYKRKEIQVKNEFEIKIEILAGCKRTR